jgi:3-oxoacyl-[acyl-carrier-protein] synthase III
MIDPVSVMSVETLGGDYAVPEDLARDLRRADDFIQMAVISGSAAVAAIPDRDLPPEGTGVFIGTAFGPLTTNFESLGSLIDDGEGQISPTLFSHSVYNAAAGYVARLLQIMGPALTVTNYGWPFLIALEEARVAVATGRIGRALVISVETYSDLLADAYCRSYGVSEVPWQKYAVAWVLEPEKAGRGLCRLHRVHLREADSDPADFLTRKAEQVSGPGLTGKLGRHPMAYAETLSRSVREYDGSDNEIQSWGLEATFGSAEIILSG